MKLILSLTLFIFLTSCAGYQLNDYSNPLKRYGIKTIKIEPFYNESNFSLAGAMFADETYNTLSEFNGLKLTRKSNKADAILIGIVTSEKSRKDSMRSTSEVIAQNIAPTNTSNRQDFNITATNRLIVIVKYYIVKDDQLQKFQAIKNLKNGSELKKSLEKATSVFSKHIAVASTLRREIYDGESSAVNYTQNQTTLRRNLREMAKQAAKQFQGALSYEKRN